MKPLILTALAFVAFAMQAQTPENTYGSKISFTLGGCNSHGQFKKQNLNDSTTGYAKGGLSLSLDYSYFTKKKRGFYVQYRSDIIGFDAQSYANDAQADIGSGYKWSEYTASNYKNRSLNFGACNIFPIGQRMAIIIRAGIGSSWSTQRKLDITFTDGTDKFRLVMDPVKTNVLNTHLGFDFIYNITERIGLTYKYQYLWQSPKFENTQHAYFNGINFDNATYNYSQPFNYGSSTIGALVHF